MAKQQSGLHAIKDWNEIPVHVESSGMTGFHEKEGSDLLMISNM